MSVTFPNEIWPSEAEVEALDGTTDEDTGLPYISKGTSPTSSPSYAIQYNRGQQRLRQILAGWRQGMVVHEGSLNIGVYPIYFTQDGCRKMFLGASGISIPDDSSKVVYVDDTATLQVADNWPTDITTYLPLATVGASGGVLSLSDRRPWAAFYVPSITASMAVNRYALTCYRSSVGSSESDTEIYRFDPQAELTLEEVQIYCAGVSDSASVDIKEDGVSVLSSAASPVAGSIVKPTIADATIAADKDLTVHVTTDGTGSIDELSVTMLCAFSMF